MAGGQPFFLPCDADGLDVIGGATVEMLGPCSALCASSAKRSVQGPHHLVPGGTVQMLLRGTCGENKVTKSTAGCQPNGALPTYLLVRMLGTYSTSNY